jgi:hypothetical protein
LRDAGMRGGRGIESCMVREDRGNKQVFHRGGISLKKTFSPEEILLLDWIIVYISHAKIIYTH